MQKCARCGNEFSERECPHCAGSVGLSEEESNKASGKYPLVAFAGLAGMAASFYLYPTVERHLLPVTGLCLFFLPLILQVFSSTRRWLTSEMNRLRKVYLYCSAGVVLVALVMVMNGALDWVPPTVVRSSVVAMRITNGRYWSTHRLVLVSWQPGRATEDLAVESAVYAGASVGRRVSVEVHKGFFGLPWYGKVAVE